MHCPPVCHSHAVLQGFSISLEYNQGSYWDFPDPPGFSFRQSHLLPLHCSVNSSHLGFHQFLKQAFFSLRGLLLYIISSKATLCISDSFSFWWSLDVSSPQSGLSDNLSKFDTPCYYSHSISVLSSLYLTQPVVFKKALTFPLDTELHDSRNLNS